MSIPDPGRVALDTLGRLYRLHQHGHSLAGYCLICRQHFAVDLVAMIAERGADSPVIGMKPLRCPSCGGMMTEKRITPPSRGSGDGAAGGERAA